MKIIHAVYQVAHGTLSFDDIAAGNRGVTGSEQAMLFTAKAQASGGHAVTCYLPTDKPGMHEGVECLDIRTAWPRLRKMDRADVAIAWLSADCLRQLPEHVLKIHSIQINDFDMCGPGYEQYVDVFVAVSAAHQQYLMQARGHPTDETKWEIIPNGVDCNRFLIGGRRIPLRCVYLSSPDRGLHWLLAMWQEIRFAHPQAELHVFYEVNKWIEAMSALNNEVGVRAAYIRRYGTFLEQHGVTFRNAVSPNFLAQELSQADVCLYPCDTVRWTEGFGVAVLEACAAGVVPVITDCDALGEVYAESGAVIVPRTVDRSWTDHFLDTTLSLLRSRDEIESRRHLVRNFAQRYDWSIVAKQWDDVIQRRRHA